MKMEQFQVNIKFLNSLPPEWQKFVTDVKLFKDLHTSNFDQLHAYLEQHELHANEVQDHLVKFHKMTNAKEMWEPIKSIFGGNDESKKMQNQLEIHGAGVSTEDENQKFLRSLPSAWSQVSLIMRTKPEVDSLSFDDLHHLLTRRMWHLFLRTLAVLMMLVLLMVFLILLVIRNRFEMAGGHDFYENEELLKKDRKKAAI
ncbi:hypothetical protein Tco_0043594, partial [Tanacetum coccineum]